MRKKKTKKKKFYFPKIYWTAHAVSVSIIIWILFIVWNWSWERMEIRLLKLVGAFIFNLFIIFVVREKTY